MTPRIFVLSPTGALAWRRAQPGRVAGSHMKTLAVGLGVGQRVRARQEGRGAAGGCGGACEQGPWADGCMCRGAGTGQCPQVQGGKDGGRGRAPRTALCGGLLRYPHP